MVLAAETSLTLALAVKFFSARIFSVNTENKIEIYTDGSCIDNPGPGGWAALVLLNGKKHTLKGAEKKTTNNRMEMTAILKALEWLRTSSGLSHDQMQKYKITIFSDSNLIIQTLKQGWKRKANTDLWAQIDNLRAWLDITWTWVKAHHTNKNNNLVDGLANTEARKIAKK
ncbi:ribonuclease HI [Candidatus Peregrinibacteria bacterium]|nr:ribonuclease HI [Candidatus Peregrinibacteria bacterium]